uniref:DH domain-containing protein n=1 Tax=Anopheles dirus TaxID=7168 RepID=A0A182NHE0_9DIPT
SSTDIGPSVLGYLDTLANNFSEEAKQLVESSSNGSKQPQPATPPAPVGGTVLPLKRVAHVSKQEAAAAVRNGGEQAVPHTDTRAAGEYTRTKAPRAANVVELVNPARARKFSDRFFNLVSPNVQRMVSNTGDDDGGGTIAPSDDTTFVRNHVQSASFSSSSSTAPGRKAARQPTTSPPRVASHKNFPLSKNIAKLTHANGELIDPFVDNLPVGRQRHHHTPSAMETVVGVAVDGNGNIAVAKRCPPVDDDELQNVSSLQRQIQSLTVGLENSERSERRDAERSRTPDESGDVVLRSEAEKGRKNTRGGIIEDAFVENCSFDMSDHRNTVVEACNFYPTLGREASSAAGPDERRTLADARAKLIDATANGNSNRKISVPDSPKQLAASRRISAEQHSTSTSTPSLDTTNSSPYSSKASLLIPPNAPVLSARPLSASSIGSFSSSASSSGSDHHLPGGKCSAPGSYQASVESLADHSEPEQGTANLLLLRPCDGLETVPCIAVSGMTMCERAVREIIDSESSYVKDLGQVIRGYLEDWKERACLKHDQLKVLFSNIQEIYDFNFKLLNRLREAKGEPVTISNCFIDLHAEFSCYTSTSYPDAISLLTTLLQATHTNALLVSTQKMLKHTLPLGSYLLKPVQRILKYHLLLDNLRKHCSDQQVALAHELMKKVAHNIDQVKTKLDQARLVKELAGILDGWLGPDLSVLGDLLHEGRLAEHTKPRIVLLFQTMLIIAKPKEDKRLQFRAYIPCKNLMLVEHLPGEPASFNVIPFDDPKGVLKLTARNREEKRLWTQQIKQAMLQHYSDIPKRAMELVLQLGDEDERFTDKPYWKRPTNNSPVPEYLERRQQFRRSEMRMRSKKNLLKKEAAVTSPTNLGSLLSTPSFRSYSSDLECVPDVPASTPVGTTVHDSSPEDCKCEVVKRQLKEEIKNRPEVAPSTASPPPKPARSRSETRCGPADDEEERLLKSLYERRKLSAPVKRGAKVKESFASIRTYNSTMIPKRISDIRKRRPKTLTSSSTFYTDLEISSDATVTDYEATEATEKPAPPGKGGEAVETSPAAKVKAHRPSSGEGGGTEQKKDSEIISQLILDVEQFNKVLNKPLAKKKSFDASSCSRPSALLNADRKPAPPSTEPPCDDEDDVSRTSDGNVSASQMTLPDAGDAEPIYESLLRNVHVPYKYAPPAALTRHSLPCGSGESGPGSTQKNAPTDDDDHHRVLVRRVNGRPESDYVTLAYSELGLLEGIVADEARSMHGGKATHQHKTPQLLRSSDTNISYHRDNGSRGKESDEEEKRDGATPARGGGVPRTDDEPAPALKQAFLERQGSLSMKTTAQKSILQRFISLHAGSASSTSSMITASSAGTSGSEGNLLMHPLQRKLSEPHAAGQHIYKQGSMDLGSRIAHLDYADPKTLLFAPHANQNVLINRASMVQSAAVVSGSDPQRDSVLASSSSSDSVCAESNPETQLDRGGTAVGIYDEEDDDHCCFYERTVEECLEHDFRDSAVYSGDDNSDRQQQHQPQPLYETLSPVAATPRTLEQPPACTGSDGPQRCSSGPPPPIPTKPAHLGRTLKRPTVAPVGGSVLSSPPADVTAKSPTNSRGWVLQQVRRFQ